MLVVSFVEATFTLTVIWYCYSSVGLGDILILHCYNETRLYTVQDFRYCYIII